jgi:histidinol-phosphate aminotransferase
MKEKFNIKKLVRSNVAKLQPYSSARDDFKSNGKEMVFLDANENPFENGLNRYPDPQQNKLKSAVAKIKNVDKNQILLGNGSDEVLDLIFRAFCEPHQDNIITLPPTYGMYTVLAGINAIENRQVLLSKTFELRENHILEKADEHSKILFICSPNNPTGNLFDKEKITFLLNNFQGLVVIDEAYADFSSEESWVNFLNSHSNLIVTQTLSKAFGMAGIRLGMCFTSPEIVTILNKIKPPYNVNQLTQEKALTRIENHQNVEREISIILKERQFLTEELKNVTFIEKIYPSDSNFALVKVDNATKRYEELLQHGIVVRNRTDQALCENTLRFTVGTESENRKLMEALKMMRS